jgi:hypothetical protein
VWRQTFKLNIKRRHKNILFFFILHFLAHFIPRFVFCNFKVKLLSVTHSKMLPRFLFFFLKTEAEFVSTTLAWKNELKSGERKKVFFLFTKNNKNTRNRTLHFIMLCMEINYDNLQLASLFLLPPLDSFFILPNCLIFHHQWIYVEKSSFFSFS